MLTVYVQGHDHFYPLCDVLRLLTDCVPKVEEDCIRVECQCEGKIVSRISDETVCTYVQEGFPGMPGERREASERFGNLASSGLPLSREIKRQLYFLLSSALGKTLPWGALTGIRPTQVAREVSCEEDLTRIYGVREDKARLAFLTRKGEDAVLQGSDPESLHIYIGIPFCPSRCSYCSFVAQEAPRKTNLLPAYVDAVLKEINLVISHISRKIESLYIGGGTPTVLDDALFQRFIEGIFEHEEFRGIREVTVEAGRADTITEAKLRTLKKAGITRICINPQTLCDTTLLRIGRRHTAEDFIRVFQLAREIGFPIINTDLIAGLPGESAEEFCESLRKILALSPENITVHSLSKKRRADLSREEVVKLEQEELQKMEKMLSFAFVSLSEKGYAPYYLYKQKDTLGGHENVGYQKGNSSCIYNVAMMGDQRSVLSFGAGGMSKRIFRDGPEKVTVRVERCSCIKDAIQYIQNVEAMAEKKLHFFEA